MKFSSCGDYFSPEISLRFERCLGSMDMEARREKAQQGARANADARPEFSQDRLHFEHQPPRGSSLTLGENHRVHARPVFIIVLAALCVVLASCKVSYSLHRYRLPDFTLDVDPSFSTSYRFRFSRNGADATLTTTAYQNTIGRRGKEIATVRQAVSSADIDGLAASMRQVSFFNVVDDSDVRDGAAWTLRLNSFPFASLSSRTLEGLPGMPEIAGRLWAISRPFRERFERPNKAPEPTR